MTINEAIIILNNHLINFREPGAFKFSEALGLATTALEAQIGKDPSVELPQKKGKCLVKDKNGQYHDALWKDGKFHIQLNQYTEAQVCPGFFVVAWWPLPTEISKEKKEGNK